VFKSGRIEKPAFREIFFIQTGACGSISDSNGSWPAASLLRFSVNVPFSGENESGAV
jgi:hypothetical protein